MRRRPSEAETLLVTEAEASAIDLQWRQAEELNALRKIAAMARLPETTFDVIKPVPGAHRLAFLRMVERAAGALPLQDAKMLFLQVSIFLGQRDEDNTHFSRLMHRADLQIHAKRSRLVSIVPGWACHNPHAGRAVEIEWALKKSPIPCPEAQREPGRPCTCRYEMVFEDEG